MLHDLTEQLEAIISRIGEPQLVIGCDCFLRRLEAEYKGQCDETSALLQHYKVMGFNTYGEHLEGMHINQTFTGVVIGRRSDE